MTEIKQGQIYAGRLSGGNPAVVRVQNEVPHAPELTQFVRLDSDMMGREGFIMNARLADSFKLVSEGPEFTSEQVSQWFADVTA